MSRSTLLTAVFAASCLAAASHSTGEGVYSKAQSDRGKTIYAEECAKCHGENLGGGEAAPPLAGADFLAKWNGRSVNEFFELTRKTMPQDDPGHLSRRQYADLVAFMLSSNEMPAGGKDLESTAEALSDIKIEAKK